MPEETKHGTPNPPGGGWGPQVECAEFDGLVSDALEGLLTADRKASFDAHRRVCGVCGPMFAEVQAGQQWLQTLEEVEPPTYLVHNILAATSGVASTRALPGTAGARTTPLGERLRERWDGFFAPVWAFVRQPRFVMSFGMIFFSFSLGLSAAGVKASDVAKVDLRPAAVRRAYIDAQVRVVKYYDNIRFVYEIESKLRELKRTNAPAEPSPEQPKENRKNDTSGQPNQRQDRNYSQEYNQPILAALPGEGDTPVMRNGVGTETPAVTGTTNRRFV